MGGGRGCGGGAGGDDVRENESDGEENMKGAR